MSDERPGIGHLKVGDEVIILRGIQRSVGVVIAQKRIWWEIGYKDCPDYRPVRVRKDTQNDDGGAYVIRFVTPEQLAWEDRRTAALTYLRSLGVAVWNSPRFQNDALTLANLIRRHDGEEEF